MGTNRYAYTLNNPVNLSDPSGFVSDEDQPSQKDDAPSATPDGFDPASAHESYRDDPPHSSGYDADPSGPSSSVGPPSPEPPGGLAGLSEDGTTSRPSGASGPEDDRPAGGMATSSTPKPASDLDVAETSGVKGARKSPTFNCVNCGAPHVGAFGVYCSDCQVKSLKPNSDVPPVLEIPGTKKESEKDEYR